MKDTRTNSAIRCSSSMKITYLVVQRGAFLLLCVRIHCERYLAPPADGTATRPHGYCLRSVPISTFFKWMYTLVKWTV
jgi:hypothetical protein